MAPILTRDFRKTMRARVRRDQRFREALVTEAVKAHLAGDTGASRSILRDLVIAVRLHRETAHVTRSRANVRRLRAAHSEIEAKIARRKR